MIFFLTNMGFQKWGEREGGPRLGKNSHIFPFFLVEDVPNYTLLFSVCAKRGAWVPIVARWKHVGDRELDIATMAEFTDNTTYERDDDISSGREHSSNLNSEGVKGDDKQLLHRAASVLLHHQHIQEISSHREAARLQRWDWKSEQNRKGKCCQQRMLKESFNDKRILSI